MKDSLQLQYVKDYLMYIKYEFTKDTETQASYQKE
jgi:hypothetical protein